MPLLNPEPRFLREAVASVLRQTIKRIELILVEDPGVRSANQVLSRFRDSRIRYFRNPARTSLIAQRNQSVTLAKAELVAFLDGDDIAEPDRGEKQLAFLQQHPEVSLVGSQVTIIDHDGRPLGYRTYPTDHAAIVATMRRFNPFAQSTVMCRTSVILAAGGYCFRNLPAEDYDLWSRLAIRGVRFANLEEKLVRYRIHSGGHKQTQLANIIRGTIAVKRRHWLGQMGLRDKARLWGELALLSIPAPLVYAAFAQMYYRKFSSSSARPHVFDGRTEHVAVVALTKSLPI